MLPLSSGFVCRDCIFFPLKREVSLFIRGKRAEVWWLPRVRLAPAPESLLLPAAAAGRPSLLPPLLPGMLAPRRRLLSCLRPLCRSPAPAYSSAAASGPARPSPTRLKSGGERGEERVRRCPPTQSGSLLPAAALAHPWHQVMGMWPHGKRCAFVPGPNRARKEPKRREVEDTTLSAATSQTASWDPLGVAVTPGTCLILMRSQSAHGEMKTTNIHRQMEGEPQTQDNDNFPPHL